MEPNFQKILGAEFHAGVPSPRVPQSTPKKSSQAPGHTSPPSLDQGLGLGPSAKAQWGFGGGPRDRESGAESNARRVFRLS